MEAYLIQAYCNTVIIMLRKHFTSLAQLDSSCISVVAGSCASINNASIHGVSVNKEKSHIIRRFPFTSVSTVSSFNNTMPPSQEDFPEKAIFERLPTSFPC